MHSYVTKEEKYDNNVTYEEVGWEVFKCLWNAEMCKKIFLLIAMMACKEGMGMVMTYVLK